MGTWGIGPFESDAAQSALGDLMHGLRDAVNQELASLHTSGELEPAIIARIVCMRVLVEQVDDAKFFLKPTDCCRWREKYMKWFDTEFEKCGCTAARLKEWRTQAIDEFDRLCRQIPEREE